MRVIMIIEFGFNPHTHAGCDLKNVIYYNDSNVSIHTPTQGVTDFFWCLVLSVHVSIHTPTQGVTSHDA